MALARPIFNVYPVKMGPRSIERRFCLHRGFPCALALVASNAVVLACYTYPDDGVRSGDIVFAYERTTLDAGDGDGGVQPKASPLHIPLYVDASLDELLKAPCEETCRYFDTRRKLESCAAPKRFLAPIAWEQSDAASPTWVYWINCMFEPLPSTKGCHPYG